MSLLSLSLLVFSYGRTLNPFLLDSKGSGHCCGWRSCRYKWLKMELSPQLAYVLCQFQQVDVQLTQSLIFPTADGSDWWNSYNR